ncbi:hypothetical protein HNQ51_003036 [Inhella inkyongensis]|uniref:PilJ/NarX-like methyl-accepting chemotaxis transducer n=1 Tax=Inhella inkyongensis TaxID=392593 RepID=A0A840SBI3_9BURK|nr:hypothetical protein [Inhella inkyongensis]MBB5205709.1 hypothetical protein [Inhella inkyongensis]
MSATPRLTHLPRRTLVLSGLFTILPAWSQTGADALLAATQLRLGVERLVKLELERRALPRLTRALQESERERPRVGAALQHLRRPWPQLNERRQAQVLRATDEAADLVADLQRTPGTLLGDSEAVAVRLGFVTTTLSGLAPDPERAALVDLLARAGTTALRVGKLNFAAAMETGRGSASVAVAAQQSVIEFESALQSLGRQRLGERATQNLELAQHQWVLFRAALSPSGLVKSPDRLPEVATTTDRIAEALSRLAQQLT